MHTVKIKLFAVLFAFISFLIAQETHNLEIIWQKASPDSVFAFGRCIASGDVNGDSFSDIIIVGDSVLHSPNPDSFYRGVCWVYLGGPNPDTILDIRLSNLQKLTFWSLHSADINGDGFDDVIIGACNNGPSGQVLIFLGGNPMDTICDYRVRGPSLPSVFGCSVSSGDVNGDSFADLIVGAYGYGNLRGRVYIYLGGPSFDTIPDVILNGGHQGQSEGFGTTVGSGADVNNDNFDDLIVGAPDFGVRGEGRVYIFYGGNPMDTSYDVAMIGEVTGQNLGWTPTVSLLKSEFEYDMAVFGSAFWPYGFPTTGSGKIYVLFGGNLMDSVPDIWMIGREETTGLGRRISGAGFVNQTNSEGIISGAPTDYNSLGTVYLWLGGTLLDSTPDAWVRGEVGGDRLGWYVTSAGDINNDGKDEFMVSNYAGTNPRIWVCKYTGPGVEERPTQNAIRLTLEVKPNPTKSVMRVRCPVFVKYIKIYDITGKIIKTLDIVKVVESGEYELKWDLRDDSQKKVATGIYFIEIKTEDKMNEIKKITVVK